MQHNNHSHIFLLYNDNIRLGRLFQIGTFNLMHGDVYVYKKNPAQKCNSYSVVSASSLGLLALSASFPHAETADNAKEKSAGKRIERMQQKEPLVLAK